MVLKSGETVVESVLIVLVAPRRDGDSDGIRSDTDDGRLSIVKRQIVNEVVLSVVEGS